jgi:aminobenzoyl-glutamate transport protein
MPQSPSSPPARAQRGLADAFLSAVERAGNILPDPVTIFILLAVLALVASWMAAELGAQVTHPVTHEKIAAVNLLSAAGLRRVLTEMVPNFTGFAPLGTVLVAMIGIGIAERTGLFAAVLKSVVMAVPNWAITPTIIFAGIMSNMAADAGYVILPPLAAMIYAKLGRHPLAGLAAVFAGIGGGFSANLLLTALDPLLAGITTEAAQLMDPAYEVNATASYYFMAVSVVLLVVVGTFVSNRIVEPHLGKWENANGESPDEHVNIDRLTPDERRGLIAAAVALVVTCLVIVLLVVPNGAPLRDPAAGPDASVLDRIKPFFDSMVALLAIFFAVPGLAYGIATRHVRNDRDAAKMMSDTMSTMGTYIVMAFFAGQFIAYFNWSKLGLIIAITGADLLKSAHLTGIPLMIAFVIVAGTINLFMASASAKWAIMAPVFVPMLMVLGWSPEVTQGLYRVGDSVTNVITPLNYYLPIIIAVAQRYRPRAAMGTILAPMVPYSIAFGICWTAMIVLWLTLGIPVGPGAPLTYATG